MGTGAFWRTGLLVPVVLALDHLDDDAGQGCLVELEEWRLCGRCEIFR